MAWFFFYHIPNRVGMWNCWFWKTRETSAPIEKPFRAKTRTTNELNPHMTAAHSVHFPTPETVRQMGTSFRCNHFWDRLGGQALVMIGWWYSRQPLTNHKDCLSIKQSQKSPVGTPPYAQRRQMHVGCFLRQSVCYGFAERKWKKMAGNVKESSPKMAFAAIKTNQKWWSPWITNTKKKLERTFVIVLNVML